MYIPNSMRLAEFLYMGDINNYLSSEEIERIPKKTWDESYKIIELMQIGSQVIDVFHLVNSSGNYAGCFKALLITNDDVDNDYKGLIKDLGLVLYEINKGINVVELEKVIWPRTSAISNCIKCGNKLYVGDKMKYHYKERHLGYSHLTCESFD